MSLNALNLTKSNQLQKDLAGLNQLSKDGIIGVVDLVESMHQRIYSLGGLLSNGNPDQTTGLTRFIYQSIRKTTQFSVKSIDFALQKFAPLAPISVDSEKRTNWLSILNGIIGDHLAATNNPLALEMTWHHQGKQISPVEAALICKQKKGRPLFLIHGLCMNDQLWRQQGHDHGHALAENNAIIPFYIRYNTGLAIYQNGQKLAKMMQDFSKVSANHSIEVLSHSMGGLVMRSAMQVAVSTDAKWLKAVQNVIFLGTPHQGALLEKTGNILDYLMSINPYSAPFAKLAKTRSHGIKNLRHGTVTADHQTIQLPQQIKAHALAANTHENEYAPAHKNWVGDGLVTVDSALGLHRDKNLSIHFPEQQRWVFNNVNHMSLLYERQVYEKILEIITQ